jgi:hypothetical protein
MHNFRALYNLVFLGAIFTFGVYAEERALERPAERPHEELMVAKGIKDGVIKGQEIIYANENVSILCRAEEVNRNYSLWSPIDKNINIPFNKEEFISYNSHAYGSVALDIVGDANNIIPRINYDIEFKKFRNSNNFSLKASLDQGLSQSSSEVSTDKNSKRFGYTLGLEYNYRFLAEFEMSVGGRIDNEVYRITSPQLDIPTTRVMATIAATYHLMAFSKDKNNYYLTLAAGLGNSKTTISGVTSSGYVTLLPEARIGHLTPFSKSVAMFFEASIESLSAHEKFSDSTVQDTNILNARLTLGLRF